MAQKTIKEYQRQVI